MNGFGEFLYELRKEKGMTQTELARALGVTNKAVSKWETGEAMPETSLLLPIARIFGVSVDELLAGKRSAGPDKRAAENGVQSPADHLFARGKDDEKTLLDKIQGAICAAIVLLGIAAYLLIGTLKGLWDPYWMIIPVCALSCGIIGIIFDLCNRTKRKAKADRGENPYTGGICGIVMLTCIIVYLFLGALCGLWHPFWIIVVCGALACGVIGIIGEFFFRGKRKESDD